MFSFNARVFIENLSWTMHPAYNIVTFGKLDPGMSWTTDGVGTFGLCSAAVTI
jgi:hypothetical protein